MADLTHEPHVTAGTVGNSYGRVRTAHAAHHAHRPRPPRRDVASLQDTRGVPLTVADVEQVVIRGRLILGVLLAYSEGADIGRVWNAAERVANDLDMEVELSTGRNKRMPKRSGRLHVTVLGAPLKPAAMAGIAGRISAHGANIDRIERLAQEPRHLHRDGRLRRRPRRAPRRADRRGRRAAGRRRRPAGRAAPARQAADRHGRRLHPHPGRGHRAARRARRLPGRGRQGHRGRDARRAGLRGLAARAGRAAGRARRVRDRQGARRVELAAGRPHAGPDPQAPRLPVRDRQRRLHPGHRRPRRGPRHRLRRRQHAGDRGRQAHRAA